MTTVHGMSKTNVNNEDGNTGVGDGNDDLNDNDAVFSLLAWWYDEKVRHWKCASATGRKRVLQQTTSADRDADMRIRDAASTSVLVGNVWQEIASWKWRVKDSWIFCQNLRHVTFIGWQCSNITNILEFARVAQLWRKTYLANRVRILAVAGYI